MPNKLIDIHSAPKYIWGDNCESFVLVDSNDLSIKQEMMPPTTREKLHFHNTSQQFFYILKGSATFFIDNEFLNVREGQGIHIHPNSKHYIENRSDENLAFLVISQPTTNNDRIVINN